MISRLAKDIYEVDMHLRALDEVKVCEQTMLA